MSEQGPLKSWLKIQTFAIKSWLKIQSNSNPEQISGTWSCDGHVTITQVPGRSCTCYILRTTDLGNGFQVHLIILISSHSLESWDNCFLNMNILKQP